MIIFKKLIEIILFLLNSNNFNSKNNKKMVSRKINREKNKKLTNLVGVKMILVFRREHGSHGDVDCEGDNGYGDGVKEKVG